MAKQKVTLTDNSIKSGVTSDANKAMTKTMASVRFHNGFCRMRSVYLEGNGVIANNCGCFDVIFETKERNIRQSAELIS